MTITVRALLPSDRAQWDLLWRAYQVFYEAEIATDATDALWKRLHDPTEPLDGFGAFEVGDPAERGAEAMVGIAHTVLHRSTWTIADYCYLQDLFVDPARRGAGTGRALIDAVTAFARRKGADRVHWLTHETNAQAMTLYAKVAKRTGFVQYRRPT